MLTIPGKIILYADDDPDDRELMDHIVNHLDPSIQILQTENGEALLQQLRELNSKGESPSLIILDINMPVLNGRETLEKIKASPEWDHIPVAFFTTSAGAPQNNELRSKYHVDIITKPVTYAEMMHEIDRMLSFCSGV